MQVSVDVHQHQQHASLESLIALADVAAGLGPDMRAPELEGLAIGNKTQPQNSAVDIALERAAQKDAAVLSKEELVRKYGQPRADKAIAIVQSQTPTLQQAFMKRQHAVRVANAEFGKALQATGVQIQQHTVNDFTHVVRVQLDQWALGNAPSVSEVLRIAFPDAPQKAKSIRGSTRVKRWREAYNSDAVLSHPMEVAMQLTHDKNCMNGRHTARNFGQSLSMNTTLFKSCDRITKLEARVQLLEQQMQITKNREALADAGATSSRDKVLSLHAAGIGPTDIARELGMNLPAVKKAIQRARKAG